MLICAEEESRTPMALRPLAPEASASANSATPACVLILRPVGLEEKRQGHVSVCL